MSRLGVDYVNIFLIVVSCIVSPVSILSYKYVHFEFLRAAETTRRRSRSVYVRGQPERCCVIVEHRSEVVLMELVTVDFGSCCFSN